MGKYPIVPKRRDRVDPEKGASSQLPRRGKPYVAQELQPLLQAGTTYAKGLFRALKLPDSLLIYYQI